MKRKVSARSAFFNPRLIAGFVLCFVGIALGLGAVSVTSGTADAQATASDETTRSTVAQSDNGAAQRTKPQERTAVRSGRAFQGDLRTLPYIPVAKKERPEREPPAFVPRVYQPPTGTSALAPNTGKSVLATAAVNAPAPTPSTTFDGLDYATWGAGHPPDTNGDVGPTYYIQTVNTSIGIYNKSTGVRVAAFTFDTLMSQGQFGNLCDTDNFGDPVVLYDSFENRWVITDFAFKIDNSGNVINPPGAFQCFAVSKTGDPVSGGWNFYSINTSGGLGDYPKFGVWPDGIYMSANMFDYATTGSFQNVRVYAFNKAQMYAGAPTVQVVSFNVDPADFTLLPSNARLQSGTPPAGRPNLFISTWEYLNALTVYKFYVDWNHISLSTFTGPDVPATGSSWPNQSVPNAATPANTLDTLGIRAMAQNQYTNIAGTESLWTTHTVRRATNGFATPRWYQVNVTGGTVAANTLQTASWDPNGADVTYRYIPSLAVDRAGDMALGYTTSNSTTNPGLKYAGRLSTDAANTFSQTEQTLWQGTASQSGTCGASTCTRWGDYSAMTLDPDGCRFWYTNEYYAVNGLNDLTRIGAFKYSQCTPVGSGGTVSGQVTIFGSGTPISGATVALGSRTTTTNGSGDYSFSNIPAGTYPSITASAPGYNSATQSPVVVADNATATKNFALATAPVSACLTDTTQSDFQSGVPTNTDLNSSPGNVQLANSGSGFASSGNFISSLKDANPSSGSTAQWTTLSWTGSAPASTTLRFQAAASNDANGVFDFVGPDGTPNTFFSSGGSLARFNGFRYLKYKALLSTTNSSVTPVVNDVTVCFNNSPGGPTPTPTPTPTATPTPTPTITPTPTPTPKQDQTITFPPISTKTYGDADFDPGATASSGLAVTYTTSGQCTMVSNKIHITAAGSCIVTANQSGNGQYNPARPVSQSFSILKAGTTTTSSLLANSPNPTPQFSDTAKLTATVKANTTVTGNGVFSGTVSFTFNGVAVGSAITVSNSSPTAQLSLKLDQTRIPLGAGNYNINATFTPSASSNYGASTSGAHAVAVRHEGQKADYTGDGSARLDYTGTQYALLGSAPTLSAMLRQSLAPDVEPEFVDFSKVNTYVVFKIVPAACGTSCSDTPVWQSANIKINNRADWSTTGIGTAQVTAPTTLGERSYLVLVNVVTNGYILAERAAATLDVFSTTGRFITGGGSVTTDSTSNAGTRRGYFGFDVKGTTTVSGSSIYLYRLRMNVSTSTATNIVTCSTMGNGCTDVDIILRSNAISSLNTGTSLTYPLTGFTAGHAAAQFVNAYSGGHYTQFEFANGFFRLDILDNSSGGSTDKYGFTAYRGNGSIFHQAYIGPIAQTGILAKTNEITIGGGNTTVHPK